MQSLDFDNMTETEKKVGLFLNELNLQWFYESPVFLYDNEDRPRVWTPDFYLPKLGMHIEVWNSEKSSSDYRERAYRKNGYNVIFVHTFKEESQWQNFLISRITAIEIQRHTQVMGMLLGKSLNKAAIANSHG